MVHAKRSLAIAVGALALAGCRPSAPTANTKTAEAPVRFVELPGALDFHGEIPGPRPLNALQTIGSGCAFLDFDNDGNLDILMVARQPVLYKGDGKGGFTRTDLLPKSLNGQFIGCAVGDYDSDGFDDLYLSAYRGGVLLHNEAGKGFKDVSVGSGVASQPFGTACAWAETVPGSGKLDLIVANYCKFGADQGAPLLCNARSPDGKPLQTSCPPRQYIPLPAVLFRNSNSGKFQLESTPTTGRGLGIAVADPDGTGKQQIALANDEIEGDLIVRDKNKLINRGPDAGVHVDADGSVHGGMGADWGDYDNDGKLDLIIATFNNEAKSLYRNEGDGLYRDSSQAAGTSLPLLPYVSFGTKFFDADNDGLLDLLFANGHVQDNIAEIDRSQSYRQPCVLLRNQDGRRFEDITKDASTALTRPIVGRGLAVGDYDNDGRMDVLVGDIEGAPLLLHNESPQKSWIGFTLEGTRSNRNGYGARVSVTVGGKTYVRHCHTDGSYLSASDKRVHFGLGNATQIEKISIQWPSGVQQTVSNAALNRYNAVKETP